MVSTHTIKISTIEADVTTIYFIQVYTTAICILKIWEYKLYVMFTPTINTIC